jgi:hypothetical protein
MPDLPAASARRRIRGHRRAKDAGGSKPAQRRLQKRFNKKKDRAVKAGNDAPDDSLALDHGGVSLAAR